MAKEIFHKIDSGEFTRDGIKYDYVVEHNKNEPLEVGKEKNIRVRIIKEAPKVNTVRTRYDPEIQTFGDANGFMPVSIGYNVTGLKRAKYILYGCISALVFYTFLSTGMSIYGRSFVLWFNNAIASLFPVSTSISQAYVEMAIPIMLGLLGIYFVWRMIFPAIASIMEINDVLKEVEEANKPVP